MGFELGHPLVVAEASELLIITGPQAGIVDEQINRLAFEAGSQGLDLVVVVDIELMNGEALQPQPLQRRTRR